MEPSNNTGVLIICHGSKNNRWNDLVDEAVGDITLPYDIPVVCSFLEEVVEGRCIQDGIDELEGRGITHIIVVPLFVSSGSTHMDEIHYALGAQSNPTIPTDLQPFRMKAQMTLCDPLDDHPIVAEMIAAKIQPVIHQPEKEIIILVGHGSNESGFKEKWEQGMRSVASQVKERSHVKAVDIALLLPDQLPSTLSKWKKEEPNCDITVVPLFLSKGYFINQVIPSRISTISCRYIEQAMLPDPLITAWMEQQIKDAIRTQSLV
ncbi:sirohydrochlorin chelatase [Longirhabdus pacifica]|uniref:sirohydrochlorin chelatase n=1 Tax=Longirhabdus pacifica TaxID=2305227 RepID=UPI001008E9B5|nr:CbiX/SirB N-terminal domain-containing protein [Longirhabdus pacifica]